jgi:hypothetical protein
MKNALGTHNQSTIYARSQPNRAYNPYSNTYNHGWADHPNFSRGGQKKNAPTTNPNPLAKSVFPESMEGLFKEFFTRNESTSSKTAEVLVSIVASQKAMKSQLGQIHKVVSERPAGLYLVSRRLQLLRRRRISRSIS